VECKDGWAWVPTLLHEKQSLGATTAGYKVVLHPYGVVPVPADRLRRRFEDGELVYAYQGVAVGWKPAIVHRPPARGTSPRTGSGEPEPEQQRSRLEELTGGSQLAGKLWEVLGESGTFRPSPRNTTATEVRGGQCANMMGWYWIRARVGASEHFRAPGHASASKGAEHHWTRR